MTSREVSRSLSRTRTLNSPISVLWATPIPSCCQARTPPDGSCLIDMHIPPRGGPPPHRHDFEETFILLEGEIEATFRGERLLVRAGDTVNIPANAPHQFHNASAKPVRMLCICAPSGQEEIGRASCRER